jgi:hypothetical protein
MATDARRDEALRAGAARFERQCPRLRLRHRIR